MNNFCRNVFWMPFVLVLVVAQGTTFVRAAAIGTSASVGLFGSNGSPVNDFEDGILVSQAAIDTADVSAAAEAQLGEANLSPILKARVRLIDQTVDAFGNAFAAALEQYTYVGTSTTTIEYNFTITGDVSTPAGAAGNSVINSAVEFFVAPALDSNFEPDFVDDIDNIVPFITEFLGSEFIELTGNVIDGTADGNVSFTVDPGDTFFLLADLFAGASSFDASADAFSTFTGSFVDASQLRAASRTIPEPTSLLLSLLASTGLLFHRRRQTQSTLSS